MTTDEDGAELPECSWCRMPVHETWGCTCPLHQGEEETYCTESCRVAAHS